MNLPALFGSRTSLHPLAGVRHHGLLRLTLIAIVACGCTKPNPLDCSDGTCTDPAHPFCDTDGALAGEPLSCIAVACTPGTFAACRADGELVCNAAGTDYDATQCAHGCAPDIGCRLCEANQTVCANGKVQSCDANGEVTASQDCPLGCFEDQPRCREIAPSNDLASFMDMAASGPDLVIDSATLSVPDDLVVGLTGAPVQLHGFMVTAPLNGVEIHVIPVRSLSISGSVRIVTHTGGAGPAIAFVVYGDATIDGRLVLGGDGNSPPGSISDGDCVGEVGIVDVAGVGYFVGGGGGGAAGRGGNGGGQFYPARKGGAAFLNPALQPLRGGCDGGTPSDQGPPGYGGGAIQITSRSKIQLGLDASIEANGSVGFAGVSVGLPGDEATPGGGGSGGSILLEAPEVIFDSGVILAANGGAGTNGAAQRGTPAVGLMPSLGKECDVPLDCTKGGDGGSITTLNIDAPSVAFQGQQQIYTGAGGGSVGYVRINTISGAYTKPGDVYESPSPSTGVLATR